MYTYTYETRYGDFKDFETIKKGSVIDIIQDISTKCSEECGFGMFKLRDMQRAWLLKGINIHFDKEIKTFTPITVETAVKPLKGATSHRCCLIYQEGEVRAKSIAEWFLFDTENLRPIRIPPELAEAYEVVDFEDEFFTFRKAEIITDAPVLYNVKVLNKDIDTNKHLNNQKSADMLMDALPFEFEFNNINLLYKKQAYLGDELEVCVNQTENGYYVHLQTKEKEICVIGNFTNI